MSSMSKKFLKVFDRIGTLSTIYQVIGSFIPASVFFLLGKLAKFGTETLAITVLILFVITVVSLLVNYRLYKRRMVSRPSEKSRSDLIQTNVQYVPIENAHSRNIVSPAIETVGYRQTGGISNLKNTTIRDKKVSVDHKGGILNSDGMDIER
jgi:hypothetical protein